MDGFTRVSVASAEKNYHDGGCGDRNLEEAAHLKRVVGVLFGPNSTDVLFERPVKTFVLMGSGCFEPPLKSSRAQLLFCFVFGIKRPTLSIHAWSTSSHFPSGVHLAHSLPTRIDCVPEDSWIY